MPEKKEKIPVKTEKKGEIMTWRPEFLSEMDRMLEDFRRNFEPMFTPMRRGWMRPWFSRFELPQVRQPFTDMIDSGKEYRVCAEVPGVRKEDLNVTISSRGMEIQAETKTDIKKEEEGFIRQERGYSKIYRSVAFPEEVVPDKAEAELKDGLLEVRIPKRTPTEVRKLKVQIK